MSISLPRDVSPSGGSYSEAEFQPTPQRASNSHEMSAASEEPAFDHNLLTERSYQERLQGVIDALDLPASTATPQAPPQPTHTGPATRNPAHQSASINKPLPPPPDVQTDAFGRYQASSRLAPHISVYGDGDFHHSVDKALGELAQGPSGQKLINDFQGPAQKGNALTIRQTNADNIAASAHLNPRQAARYSGLGITEGNAKANELAKKRPLGLKGEGSNAQITWNPNKSLRLDPGGRPTGLADDPSESHLALAHEMVHARRMVKGTSTLGSGGDRHDGATPAGKEELRAVGIGSKANRNRVSENSIRQELGFPLRTSYNKVPEPQRPPSPEITFAKRNQTPPSDTE